MKLASLLESRFREEVFTRLGPAVTLYWSSTSVPVQGKAELLAASPRGCSPPLTSAIQTCLLQFPSTVSINNEVDS